MTPPTWRAVYLEAAREELAGAFLHACFSFAALRLAAQHLRAAVGAGRERVTVRTSATWWPRSERGTS